MARYGPSSPASHSLASATAAGSPAARQIQSQYRLASSSSVAVKPATCESATISSGKTRTTISVGLLSGRNRASSRTGKSASGSSSSRISNANANVMSGRSGGSIGGSIGSGPTGGGSTAPV